jgi:hypothetical protein
MVATARNSRNILSSIELEEGAIISEFYQFTPNAAIVLVRRSGLALEMEHRESVQARERLGMLISNVMCLCARDPAFFLRLSPNLRTTVAARLNSLRSRDEHSL